MPQHPLKGGALESSYRHSHRLDFFDKNRYPCEVEPHRGIYFCHIHRKRRQSFLCRGGVTAHARRGLNTLRHLPENIYKALCVSGKGIILLPQEHRYGFILQPEEGNGPYSRIFVYQLTGACPKEIGSVYSSRSINCPRSFISMRRLAEAYSSASV